MSCKPIGTTVMKSNSLFGFTTKYTWHIILCQRRRVYAGKKRLRWHRHLNAFFDLKTVVNQKRVNLGMISARHTTNRQSFKKVTWPFNNWSDDPLPDIENFSFLENNRMFEFLARVHISLKSWFISVKSLRHSQRIER